MPGTMERALLESERTLLGFERAPPTELLETTCWRRDSPASYCGRCGATLQQADEACGECTSWRLPYSCVVRLGAYEEPLASWIRVVKFSRWDAMGRRLGVELAHALEGRLAQQARRRTLVVPVPMPCLRRVIRGIDHARVLASALARSRELSMRNPLRQRSGATQASRTAAQRARRRNPIAVSRFARRLDGETVVLVDDVLTSSRTARAAAKAVRQLGAGEVMLAVVAVAGRSGS